MTIFESIVQGVIQGITEFLPISSSGHLTIAQYFLGQKENNLLFDVCLHLGTLISVFFVYRNIFFKLFISSFTIIPKFFSGKKRNYDEKTVINLFFSLLPLFFLFVPLPKTKNLKTFASNLASSGDISIVGFSLIATSILLIAGFLYSRRVCSKKKNCYNKMSDMSLTNSFVIGVSQLFATIFPGLSRSGTTLSIGLLQGINRETALDFSFIMGTPAILAASFLELIEAKSRGIHIEVFPVLTGVLVSAFVGFLSIKLFKWVLSNDKTWIFSLYSFILGILILIFKNWV